MHSAEDKFRAYLRSKGLKFTPEREIILKEAFRLHHHFDVEELFARLRKRRTAISRASIYRTLPLLVESGLIKETFHCQKHTKYEHTFGHDHHDHLLCIKCGRVYEFKNEQIERLQKAVCKKYKFKPVEHRLGIRGYCQKCRPRQGG